MLCAHSDSHGYGLSAENRVVKALNGVEYRELQKNNGMYPTCTAGVRIPASSEAHNSQAPTPDSRRKNMRQAVEDECDMRFFHMFQLNKHGCSHVPRRKQVYSVAS